MPSIIYFNFWLAEEMVQAVGLDLCRFLPTQFNSIQLSSAQLSSTQLNTTQQNSTLVLFCSVLFPKESWVSSEETSCIYFSGWKQKFRNSFSTQGQVLSFLLV